MILNMIYYSYWILPLSINPCFVCLFSFSNSELHVYLNSMTENVFCLFSYLVNFPFALYCFFFILQREKYVLMLGQEINVVQ